MTIAILAALIAAIAGAIALLASWLNRFEDRLLELVRQEFDRRRPTNYHPEDHSTPICSKIPGCPRGHYPGLRCMEIEGCPLKTERALPDREGA